MAKHVIDHTRLQDDQIRLRNFLTVERRHRPLHPADNPFMRRKAPAIDGRRLQEFLRIARGRLT